VVREPAARRGRARRATLRVLGALPLLAVAGYIVTLAVSSSAPAQQSLGAPAPFVAPVTEPLPPGVAQVADADPEGARAAGIASLADTAWIAATATATGIPERALAAYAGASLALKLEQPGCRLGWTTLAALGFIESGHGTHGGTGLLASGYPAVPIVGPALNGEGFAAIPDSDGGVWDTDPVWDRAVGPLQFIPETWERWGADGNGDGEYDPNQIDDAVLGAGRYLCHSGSMETPQGWRAAVFSYNHLEVYVDDVAAAANRYAAAAL
jgi:membrane-bound lytic murein transglycosylase B